MAFRAAFVLALIAAPLVFADSHVLQQLSSSQFSGFHKLLEHADLLPEIEAAMRSGKGLTLFCPTDDALMYHTSPTLLAFLKLRENREMLRKVLLSHVVVERLSPFQWEGEHQTLGGQSVSLSMDAQAFYAANVAVMQYNALVSGDAAVHSIPTLIIPAGVSAADSAKMFVEEGLEARRSLQAMAPGPVSMAPPSDPAVSPPSSGAVSQALVSGFAVVLSIAVAALMA